MAGVAGPMLRRSVPQGARFLTGLLAGGLLASLLLAFGVDRLGTAVALVLPDGYRRAAAVLLLLVLAGFDLADRTPHLWRQVPQALVRTLPPGRLGLVWGFDLSLLFTTQKSTSLTWAGLVGTLLLAPQAAWVVLPAMTLTGLLAITARSVHYARSGPARLGDRGRPWHRHVRRLAGCGLLTLAVALGTLGTALGGM
jgi:hypothetical protein